MIKNNVVNLLDTVRMCFLSESEKGDLVIICKDGHVTVSRVLFSLCCSLLKPQLEEDFMNQENSCITLEVEKAKFELLFQKLLFASGEIDKSFVIEFPFIDWRKFSVSDPSTKIPSNESRPYLKESFSKNTPILMPKIQSPAEGVVKVAENVRKSDMENSKPRVECNICGKSLSDKKNLKKHCDVVHFNIRKFNCEICIKRFITRKDLMIHIQSIHNQQKFICDQCGQALSTQQGLRQHSLIHKEGSKSIPCSRCALKVSWYLLQKELDQERN